MVHAQIWSGNPNGTLVTEIETTETGRVLDVGAGEGGDAVWLAPDGRGIDNVLAAVSIGGTLLVVGHDLAPMRVPIDTMSHSRLFDPDAFVRVDDFVEAIANSSDWEIEVNQTRPRPPGAASSHHVDDVVLRARRVGPVSN